ncbi:hypothetical protein GQ55_8G016800 [Panicum hallii var. hallii]|uniref:CYTH domain-containing protein n=1 Tax=Panicum hallii var. hallii TaxID=1504633 RepID=A0A2T7CJL6_9POAL|nr:hypothetical protein GQ55_8G016800 [Panicum hallii var. hallii]
MKTLPWLRAASLRSTSPFLTLSIPIQCCAATPPASSSGHPTATSSRTTSAPPPLPPPKHPPPPQATPRRPRTPPPPPTPSSTSSTRRPAPRLPRPSASASPPRPPRTPQGPPPSFPPIPMEVEIKLRLPDAAAHRRLSSFLAPRLRRTHAQRNLFFDAAARPLAAATAALRVRLYGPDDRAPLRAVLALKRRARIDAGVSRVEEVEEPLDPALALACADDPARLGGVDSPIVRLVAAEYGVGGDAAPFVCLGGFRNTRAVYELEDDGLVLELDETRFEFGTSYELECETAEPDRAKEVLERLLTVAGVPYEYSRSNKFGCFMAGKLLP